MQPRRALVATFLALEPTEQISFGLGRVAADPGALWLPVEPGVDLPEPELPMMA